MYSLILLNFSSDGEGSLTAERSYQLLVRNCQIFRDEYIYKLQQAKMELDKR